MRNLRHVLVVLAQSLALLADLVEALGLQQHARVGARQPGNGECTHHRRGYESIRVMQRERNLPHPSIFISGNKKDVIAFAQHKPALIPHIPGKAAIRQGLNKKAKGAQVFHEDQKFYG